MTTTYKNTSNLHQSSAKEGGPLTVKRKKYVKVKKMYYADSFKVMEIVPTLMKTILLVSE